MALEKDIKKALETKKIVIGAKSVVSALKHAELAEVIAASNCPPNLKADIEHNAKLSQVPLKAFEGNSTDLGSLCVKPFNIAVVGIKK